VIPILPELVRELAGLARAQASVAVGGVVAAFALAQLFASPVLGALSDRFGRRPVLLLSIAGIAANYVLLAWAPSLGWIYLGRLLAGATSANVATASAYIADVTPDAQRARRFGLVGATFSVGFVLGPALGGWLGAIDLRLPFVTAAALAGANLLYGLFVLPESLPAERRCGFAWRGANPVAALRSLAADPVLRRLALAWSCQWLGLGALQTVFVLYTGARFGWGPPENGAALAVVGVSGAVVQTLLVRPATQRLGERRAALFGYLVSCAAYAWLALAPVGWAIYLAIMGNALGQIAVPAARAMVSLRVGPERQGQAFGALSVVEGLTAIASPILASALFFTFARPAAVPHLPGAPFLLAAAGFLVAFASVRGLRSPRG
jgi:DHA1 family tetracycline resistance protein-like MFS transporter